MVEEPRTFQGAVTEDLEGNVHQKTPKPKLYYKYVLKENQIEVEISNNIKKNIKLIKLPINAEKIEIFKTKGVINDEKSIADTLKTYFNYIVYQRKNKFGLMYHFPFTKVLNMIFRTN